jgi:AraC-like DNA-binding protein
VQAAPVVEWQVARPAAPLRRCVRRYVGYRLEGFGPGTHLGLPSRHLTVVVSLGDPTRITEMPEPGQPPGAFQLLASGLTTRRAVLAHDGRQHGVQLEMTPAGARALLGLPAGELGASVVGLDVLLGPSAWEAAERLAALQTWGERFAALDEVLMRSLDRMPGASPELERAWSVLVTSRGAVRIGDLARELGWSRRHLGSRFRVEYGLTPKEAARVVRFERSRWMLAGPGRPRLGEVAATCGFYDQAHLCREWAALAGCSPTSWLAGEEFPSVHAEQEPAPTLRGQEFPSVQDMR